MPPNNPPPEQGGPGPNGPPNSFNVPPMGNDQ